MDCFFSFLSSSSACFHRSSPAVQSPLYSNAGAAAALAGAAVVTVSASWICAAAGSGAAAGAAITAGAAFTLGAAGAAADAALARADPVLLCSSQRHTAAHLLFQLLYPGQQSSNRAAFDAAQVKQA